MKIVYSDKMQPLKNTVVVLGNFDGVHIAHQALIKKAVEIGSISNLKVVIYTFYEHPRTFLGENISMITTNSEKEEIFENLGIDVLVYQKLSCRFLNMEPEMFVENVLIEQLGATCIVVGEHYTFGAKASGNSELLIKIGQQYGIEICVEQLMLHNNVLVSSSNIRNYLYAGRIEEANAFLGREYCISGEVVHGNHLGTEIGFPTANIFFTEKKIVPKYGVYACKTLIGGVEYNSIANIGIKPTVGSDKPLVEAHIFDLNDKCYGKSVAVKLCHFIRNEVKFDSVEQLSNQIKIDIRSVVEYFSHTDK